MASQTVLITGGNGFIGRHIVAAFLDAGWHVRASIRNLDKAPEISSSIADHLGRNVDDALSFVRLDLSSDEGWNEACSGIDVLVHSASPFPIEQPTDENELIRPAVDGAVRALRFAAAQSVDRVVMTSSIAAISGQAARPNGTFDETDWTDASHPSCTAYVKSKTLAEKAAWEFVESSDGSSISLTCINPGFVLGAPIGDSAGTSVRVIQRLVDAKDPAVPKLGFSIVHVDDVAKAHLEAARRPETGGERIALASGPMWFADLSKAIKRAYPNRKVVTRVAPTPFMRLLAFFDGEVRSILPLLDRMDRIDNTKAKTLLGLDHIAPDLAVVETAKYLIDNA